MQAYKMASPSTPLSKEALAKSLQKHDRMTRLRAKELCIRVPEIPLPDRRDRSAPGALSSFAEANIPEVASNQADLEEGEIPQVETGGEDRYKVQEVIVDHSGEEPRPWSGPACRADFLIVPEAPSLGEFWRSRLSFIVWHVGTGIGLILD
jgi:hypothetical protein